QLGLQGVDRRLNADEAVDAVAVGDNRLRAPWSGQGDRHAGQHGALGIGDSPFDSSCLRLGGDGRSRKGQREQEEEEDLRHACHKSASSYFLPGEVTRSFCVEYRAYPTPTASVARTTIPGVVLKNEPDCVAGFPL